jgi:hypothetical protein
VFEFVFRWETPTPQTKKSLPGAELQKMGNSAMFHNFFRRSPRRVFDFDQESAGSAESAARDLPRERRIFQFDEASLNSTNSSIPTTTTSSVRTMTERSNGSVVNESDAGSTLGIYEDHPGLNPTDERVVELQAAIHEEMRRLMIGRDPHKVLAAAERVHGESNDPEFLEEQYQDLVQNGTASEAFQIGVQQLGPYDEMHLSLSTTSHLSMTTSLSDMCSASLAASFTHFHGSYSA